ncbi:plasmid replication protein, CyRepA1 family [Undibacterium sp. SXout11W]|uniref:plasmid replication protein, CyRepA1 family n=1 Tax=Undibacterium sp. SXout11W TaxID=3413050 RepID=UPI003BF28F42
MSMPTNKQKFSELRQLLAENCEVHSEKYLRKLTLNKGVTYVRSPKGSGKTEQLVRIVELCKDQGLSVLLIGHRQTLIHSMAARLGLTCYLKVEDGKQSNNEADAYYAICVDSMPKLLKPNLRSYNVILIDEAEQMLSHLLVSDTLKSKRRQCFKMLCHYLKHASSIVLCDADLGQITLETIRQAVDASVPRHFIMNDYMPPKRQFDLYADDEHLTADMMAIIANGGRHFIVSNSKRRATALHAAIVAAHPEKKTMLITSSQSSDDAAQHFINHIKTEILNYEVVVVSPSLGTGIDITFEGAAQLIDTVFGFFVPRVNTHFDMDQQLARVRHPKDLKVWVTPERFVFETDPSAIEAELIMCRNLNHMIEDYEPSGMPVLDKSYLKVYTQVVAMQRASKNSLRKNFIDLRAQNGWEANLIARSKESATIGREAMKAAKASLEQKRILAIINATPITDQEYELLIERQKIQVLKPADENALRHFELSSFYRSPVDEDLIAMDNDGAFRKNIRLAEVFFGAKSLIVERSKRFVDSEALASDALYLPLKRELLRELLTSAGVTDSENIIKSDAVVTKASLTDFVVALRRNTRKIQELFDLSIRADLPEKPMQSLSEILKLIGLGMINTANYKVGDGDRIREYGIDTSKLDLVKDIITRRASNAAHSTTLIRPKPKNQYTKPKGSGSRTRKVGKQEAQDPVMWRAKKRAKAEKERKKAENEFKVFCNDYQVQLPMPTNVSLLSKGNERQLYKPPIEDQPQPQNVGPALLEIRKKTGTPALSSNEPLLKLASNDSRFVTPRTLKDIS